MHGACCAESFICSIQFLGFWERKKNVKKKENIKTTYPWGRSGDGLRGWALQCVYSSALYSAHRLWMDIQLVMGNQIWRVVSPKNINIYKLHPNPFLLRCFQCCVRGHASHTIQIAANNGCRLFSPKCLQQLVSLCLSFIWIFTILFPPSVLFYPKRFDAEKDHLEADIAGKRRSVRAEAQRRYRCFASRAGSPRMCFASSIWWRACWTKEYNTSAATSGTRRHIATFAHVLS